MATQRLTTQKSVTRSTKLGPEEREAAIRRLKEKELDILVVGGGIVGTGAALDAVTRGLSTGLLEARDWASGTSSRSSKLVHGGIRYLEQLDFRLVREALIERGLLLQRIAPHLVKPVRFLYPLKRRVFERIYVGAGMLLYDVFSYTGGRPPGAAYTWFMYAYDGVDKRPLNGRLSQPGMTALSFYVDDVRAMLATLKAAGARVETQGGEPVTIEGVDRVFVRDPSGILIELRPAP